MLMVKWSDLTEKLIYRTYPEMHTLHVSSSALQSKSPADVKNKTKMRLLHLYSDLLFVLVTEIAEGDVSHRGWSNRKEGQNHSFITR